MISEYITKNNHADSPPPSHPIKPIESLNNEWLSRLLLKFKYANPLSVFLIALIIILLRDILISYSYGVLPKLVNDPVTLLHDLLVQPTFFGFFMWLQLHGLEIFNKLQENAIVPTKGDCEHEIRSCKRLLQNRWAMTFAGFMVSLLIVALWMITTSKIAPQTFWVVANPHILSWLAFTNFFIGYVIALVIIDMIQITYSLYKIFNSKNISVQALHPDGAGGLGVIGKFSWNCIFIIAPIGFTYSVNIINRYMLHSNFFGDHGISIFIPVIVYLVLAPIIYFIPLVGAHKKMVEFRDRKILITSRKYEEALNQLSSISQNSRGEYDECLHQVKGLKEQWAIEMTYPVWPIKIIDLKSYFGFIFSSILVPVVLQIILNQIVKILNY
jgi:hypothetical protein